MTVSRTARIFLSSTFRDFGEERDLLVRKVFPGLRARLKVRFVELVDVDLRWGITAEQAERGEVLPICLAEIDRSRPFFVGLLGERYGWVPEKEKYPPELVEQRPWLKKHQGGKSVTELEILHGVLNNPKMAGRALFYFRSSAYAKQKGRDYLPQSPEDRSRQKDLKARIRDSGFPLVQGYKDPEALAKRLERDLWKILDEIYPADAVPDAFIREGFRHEAYAVPRRRLYLGGEGYIEALDAALGEGKQRILVEGASGGGKSALIANWLEKRGKKHRNELVHVHYLGATAEASDLQALVRRLIEAIKRLTESTEEIPSDPQALYDSLSTWLAIAHAYAGKRKTKVLIVVDALNGLRDLQDLRWFPEFLPERVRLAVSCLPGPVHEALLTKGEWQRVEVTPLDRKQAKELFVAYLRRYNKELPEALLSLALNHPLSTNPLFLRTLAEELRLFGLHEQLKGRLDHYLQSKTVDDLFERVLERVEGDCGAKQVRKVMEGIWASRAGLSEHEILGFANLKPADWAPIRHALDDSLLESGGRITFAHDYMRLAVSDRYLSGNNTLPDEGQSTEALKLRRNAHIAVARWFDTRPEEEKATRGTKGKTTKSKKMSAPKTRPADARSAEEVPWQYEQAKGWKALKACLTRRDMFEAVYAHRTNEEILSYWLDIEANTKTQIEKEYKKAWKTWKPKSTEEVTGELARNLSSILKEAGRCRAQFVEDLSRLALTIETRIYGTESSEIVPCLDLLASILMQKGDYHVAETHYRKALALVEKTHEKEHSSFGPRLNNLALLLHERGDFDTAERLYRRALLIAERAHGLEHPWTGSCLNNLGRLLNDKGDCEAAEYMLRRSLAIAERTEGLDHPSTGGSLNNLAFLLHEKGDYDKAEQLYRRSLAIRERAQGPEHPETGIALNNLGVILSDKGDSDIAEVLYRRALAIAEKIQGPEHPSTGRTLNNLAELLHGKGDYDEAELLHRRALAITEKALGVEHPDTGTSLKNLAWVLKDKGDYAAAEPLCRRALSIAERAQGADHVETGKRLNSLALLLKDKGDYESSESLYRRALAIAEAKLPVDHPDLASRIYALGNLLVDQGKFEEGETCLRRELELVEARDGKESKSVAASLYNLGNRLADSGRLSEAEPLLRREISIVETLEGNKSKSLEQSLSNLGRRLAADGSVEKAEYPLRNALSIAEENLPSDDPDLTNLLYALGNLLIEQGKFEEGESLLRRELDAVEAQEGGKSEPVFGSLYNLGNRLADRGRFEESEVLLRRAMAIEVANLGSDHEDVMGNLSNLGDVLRRAGRYADAEKEFSRAMELAGKLDFGGPFFSFAELRIDQRHYEDAAELLERCLEIRRRKLDPSNAAIGETIWKLAEVYRLMGRDAEAEDILKQLPAEDVGSS